MDRMGPDAMRVGLLADKALAHFKDGDMNAALTTLYEAVKMLPAVSLEGNLQGHHTHATVAHAVAWVNTNILKASDPRLAPTAGNEPGFTPGMCSSQEPHPDIVKHALQPLSTTHLLLASAATKVGLLPEIAEDHHAQNDRNASPLVWFDYCHAVIDRALNQFDAKALAAGMTEFASAMLWYKSSQNTLAVAPIPPATGDAMLHPGVEVTLLDYSLAFLTISIGQGRAVNETAQCLFECLNQALPAFPRSLRAALCFDAETSRQHMEPFMYEWCRCLHESAEQLQSAASLSYFLFRAVNYLVPSSQRYIAGAVVAKIAIERWEDILKNQRFSLSFPDLHEHSIRAAIGSNESDSLKLVANILLAGAQAARLKLDKSAIDFLKSICKSSVAKPL